MVQLLLPIYDIACMCATKVRNRLNDLALLTLTNGNDWHVGVEWDELVFTHPSGRAYRYAASTFSRIEPAPQRTPDVRVQVEGSIYLFYPLTPAAEEWIEEHVFNACYFGTALVVEHRFARELCEAMQNAGLQVSSL